MNITKKPLIMFMGFLISGSLLADPDNHARKNAASELAKLKRHQIYQDQEVKKELADISRAVKQLENAVMSVETSGDNNLQKKKNVIDRSYAVSSAILSSEMQKKDPETTRLILGKLGILNRSLASETVNGNQAGASSIQGYSIALSKQVVEIQSILAAVENSGE